MLRGRLRYMRTRLGSDYAGRRVRALGREAYFRAARRFTTELLAEDDGLRFHVATADRAVGLRTYAAGPPERRTLERVVELLRAREDGWPNGGALLEVGANIGTTTVVALARYGFGSAICFEPLPANHALLLTNLEENGLADRATVHRRVLSDHSGEVEFELSEQNSGDGRVRTGPPSGRDAFGEAGRQTLTVPATTLDELVRSGELGLERIALAWLDVQGHEAHVLRGATALLESRIPVVLELWPYALRRAGGLESLAELVARHFAAVIDLAAIPATPPPAEAIADLIASYDREPDLSTDLLLLR